MWESHTLKWECPECGELNPIGLRLCGEEGCIYDRKRDFLDKDLLVWVERK